MTSASGSPWPTSPIRRPRASTCSWPAGPPRRCRTRASRCTGSSLSTARAHLQRSGVPEAAGLELRGTVPLAEFRARMRAARVYAAGARWEDFGQAPLEALADGALLATVPSGGPFEALRLARELGEPDLVAPALDGEALGARDQGGLRAARGARARLSRSRARAPAPVPPEGRPGDGRARRAAAALRLTQHGALPRLGVRRERMALGHRAAARGESLAQPGLSHEPPQGGDDLGPALGVHEQRRSRRPRPRRPPRPRAGCRGAAAPPPRPRAWSPRRARRC